MKLPMKRILTQASVENAMIVHAAFGGSTNPDPAHAGNCPCRGIAATDGGRLDSH